jgi:acetoin utilization deacetylase AcuC-like enzyme
VTRSSFGGSCYLNNAAVTTQYLRDRSGARVALLDVDAHHGNGAQAIFWERDDVLTASVHVDPGAGWFPHFLGFADEVGTANLNFPLPPGAGDAIWLAAVDRLVSTAKEHEAEALVVALGVDAAADDPNSPLAVSEDGYREAGRLLGSLRLPTVLVQEGGYVLEAIGPLVRAALEGFESTR